MKDVDSKVLIALRNEKKVETWQLQMSWMFETISQVRVSCKVREKCENGDRYPENIPVLGNMTEKGMKTRSGQDAGGRKYHGVISCRRA